MMAIKKRSLLLASAVAFVFSTAAYSQAAPETQKADQQADTPHSMHDESHHSRMHGGQGGMHGMHGMQGQRGMHGMMGGMHFPPGYEKLEMQMHAEMMESMAKIMKKYAAQLPDKR